MSVRYYLQQVTRYILVDNASDEGRTDVAEFKCHDQALKALVSMEFGNVELGTVYGEAETKSA